MLSFAEIIKGRDASVRVTDDHMIYAVDLVMVMTGKDRNNAGRDLRELPDDKFLSTKFVDRKFQGKGNGHTKLVSFEHALELIMVLPGDEAKRTRVQFSYILKRYMAGDRSLIAEIEANGQSASPIAQMARASLAAEKVDERSLVDLKRKRNELEYSKLQAETETLWAGLEAKRIANRAAEAEIELKSRAAEAELEFKRKAAEAELESKNRAAEAELEAKKIANRAAEAEIESTKRAIRAADLANSAAEHGNLAKVSTSYHELCGNTVMDERARLIFKDSFLNMAMIKGPATTNANGEQVRAANNNDNNKPVHLSIIATELGIKVTDGDIKSIGKKLSKRYFLKHGKAPSKHDQFVNGMVMKVNSYTESDCALIEEVLREHQRDVAGKA